MNQIRGCFCLLVFVLAGCQSDVTPILTCEPGDGITPICGFQNPEDLALIPGSDWIIVSQFGLMDGSRPGNIAMFNQQTESWHVVFPVAADIQSATDPFWGTRNCARPGKEFAPHGLDLMHLGADRYRLLVVNHGGRDSVEMFEVINAGEQPEMHWKGCVEGPEDAYFNDLVNLRDGGFLVTHMMPKSGESLATFKSILGLDTGHVMHWSVDDVFHRVPGTEGPFPNGIEISEDESTIFLNIYMAGEVRKIDLESGELLGMAKIANPDNITWGNDGLLVASHVDGLAELLACSDIAEGACGFAFEIVSLNPDSMQGTTLIEHRGAPMGAATVALQIGERIYLGSFAGDRISYIDLN
jgi:hypothetical protein